LVSVLGTRQKRHQILGTRQNVVLGSALLSNKVQLVITGLTRRFPRVGLLYLVLTKHGQQYTERS